MRILLLIAHLFIFKPGHQLNDSVSLRIFNNSKYQIKQYSIVIKSNRFSFHDIPPHSYSHYEKLPYVTGSNQSELTLSVRRFSGHSYTIKSITYAVDNIGEKKIERGAATLSLKINLIHNKSNVETSLKQE